jgi:hypothetical protein
MSQVVYRLELKPEGVVPFQGAISSSVDGESVPPLSVAGGGDLAPLAGESGLISRAETGPEQIAFHWRSAWMAGMVLPAAGLTGVWPVLPACQNAALHSDRFLCKPAVCLGRAGRRKDHISAWCHPDRTGALHKGRLLRRPHNRCKAPGPQARCRPRFFC